jgi:endonuclease/exonuclease/phosphatase (EEP) superfamily protein YafD
MGDFNAGPGSAAYDRLLASGWQDSAVVAAEAGNTFAGERIDHIFFRGPGPRPLAWRRAQSPDPARRWSDHAAVVARFGWA